MSTLSAAVIPPVRGRFEGLLQILRFNSPGFLAAGFCLMAGACLMAFLPLPALIWWSLATLMALAAWWSLAALAVAHLVYDRPPTFDFRWVTPWIQGARNWLNVHAGFDQTSEMLRHAMPQMQGTPVDIFDPLVMTERSIHRARAAYPEVPGTLHARFDSLPLADASVDVVFTLFAAHELRTRAGRTRLLREICRVLKPGGRLILVEHMRGFPNFLAFGPRILHFHSRREWLRSAGAAGLLMFHEQSLTPFATALIWRKLHAL